MLRRGLSSSLKADWFLRCTLSGISCSANGGSWGWWRGRQSCVCTIKGTESQHPKRIAAHVWEDECRQPKDPWPPRQPHRWGWPEGKPWSQVSTSGRARCEARKHTPARQLQQGPMKKSVNLNASPDPRRKKHSMKPLTALPHHIGVFTEISSRAEWLHLGKANLEHRLLNPEDQAEKLTDSPLFTQGPDNLQDF